MENVLFTGASGNKGDMVGMVEDWEGQGNPLWRRLWRISDGSAPNRGLLQQLVTREQGASMTIRTHAKENQVKDGVTDRILGGKRARQLGNVIIGCFFRIQVCVDGVDVLLWDLFLEMIKKLGFGETVV